MLLPDKDEPREDPNRAKTKKGRKHKKSRKPNSYALIPEIIDPEIDSDSEKFKTKPELKTFQEFDVNVVIKFYKEFHKEEFGDIDIDEIFGNADCLQLLLLKNACEKYDGKSTETRFPMKRVVVSRAYGKVNVRMLHPSKPCQNAEYWRCENSGCIVWHGYHARMDKSMRFQHMASAELQCILNAAQLKELEYRTEKYISWNPDVDPFFSFVKYMKRSSLPEDLCDSSVIAKKVTIELGWFGDSDKKNDRQVELLWKWLHNNFLKSIKFRKWTGSRLPKPKWKHLSELDIQDRNIEIDPLKYIHCDTVHIHLETDKFLEFCDKMLKTKYKKEMITIIVNEAFSFEEAKTMVKGKYRLYPNKKYEMEPEKRKRPDRGVGIGAGARVADRVN
ncbi:hypothetical protein L3Y34_003316 [Caenorhabditis briggsae]|uniref:Uncharacterized protein n=1 Tax=Caenorhabditis briggsae TaxID=6238 RepID=A0AAE9A8U9_CAEBR|nr:hypothetical protein L3Y34_003316 [Caenorhabditis briggsae]